MTRFGDMAWAAASGGELRSFDKLAQTWEALRFRMMRRLRASPQAVGAASAGEVERMMAEVELPKSPFVAKAAELVTALGPPALTSHVLRTWAWGTVLGLRDGLVWDRESFALAALLHDLALARRTPEATCFAADGAQQAVSLLDEWGAPEQLRSTVGDAICLHLRVAVPRDFGVEAHLVHAGAALDLVGAGLAKVPVDVRARILAKHPRDGFKTFLLDTLRRESIAHPASRVALWVSLGFLDTIRTSLE